MSADKIYVTIVNHKKMQHQYVVGVYKEKKGGIMAGVNECNFRNNAYRYTVYEFELELPHNIEDIHPFMPRKTVGAGE